MKFKIWNEQLMQLMPNTDNYLIDTNGDVFELQLISPNEKCYEKHMSVKHNHLLKPVFGISPPDIDDFDVYNGDIVRLVNHKYKEHPHCRHSFIAKTLY